MGRRAGDQIMERESLFPITVRFTKDKWEKIKKLADENGLSQAEIVRMAVSENLARYLGSIRFVDTEQGTEIKRRVTELVDDVSGIRTSLDRIGVHLNQIARRLNMETKYGNGEVGRGEDELGNVFLTGMTLDMFLYRYEEASKEVASLCRILA